MPKMLKVDKFLCCFKLETGGIFVGWLSIACCALVITAASFLIAAFSIASCENLKEILERVDPNHVSEDFDDSCYARKVMAIILLVIYIIVHAFGGVIGWYCIKGTKSRNSRYLIPLLIVIAIYFIISLTCFFNITPFTVAFGLANVIFDGYVFICIYSLYAKLRDEEKVNNREGVNAQINQSEDKV